MMSCDDVHDRLNGSVNPEVFEVPQGSVLGPLDLLHSVLSLFSPDSCFLAAGSADGAVYIWNVSKGNLETRLTDKHR